MLQHGCLSQHFHLLLNHEANVQDYFVKIENNMNIKEEYFHQTSVIKKKSRTNRRFNKSCWTLQENIKYCKFIRQNSGLFELTRSNRQLAKINKLISQFVTSRSPEQCRSHHQKMIKVHANIDGIIEHIEKIEKGNPNENNNFTVRIRKKKDPQQKKKKGKLKIKHQNENNKKDKNEDKEKDNNQDKEIEKDTNKEKEKDEDNSVRIKIEESSIPFNSYVCYWDRLAKKWIKQNTMM